MEYNKDYVESLEIQLERSAQLLEKSIDSLDNTVKTFCKALSILFTVMFISLSAMVGIFLYGYFFSDYQDFNSYTNSNVIQNSDNNTIEKWGVINGIFWLDKTKKRQEA